MPIPFRAMNNLILSVLLLLILTNSSTVQAGSRLWESTISRPSTKPKHLPRWVHFSKTRTGTGIWPDKYIPICYSSPEADEALDPYIHAAMQLWYAAGLPSAYKVEKAPDRMCATERENVLQTTLRTNEFATSVGKQKARGATLGPSMVLDVRGDNLGDAAANIAHELGHAFGLYHEQQNPVFWAGNNYDYLFQFRCQYLVDFEEKAAGLSPHQIWGYEGICRNIHSAIAARFSAFNYLPMSDAIQKWNWHVDESYVDWFSIMLLPSWVGGNGRGYPVTHRNGNGILANLVPSSQDVEGVRHMYEYQESWPEEFLYNDPRSEYYHLFQYYAPGCEYWVVSDRG